MRERRVAANLGFLGRVRPQRPARQRRVRKTTTPVCSSSPPPRAGAQPPQLHVGKALPVRPRALALAGLLRRGIVGATPGAHLPTPPSMLPVIPALLPRYRGLPISAAKKRPGEQQPSRLRRRVLGRRAGLQLPPRPHRRDHERTAGCQLGARCGADAVHEAPRRKRARARRTGSRSLYCLDHISKFFFGTLHRNSARGSRWGSTLLFIKSF